jgi:hypothetical protein
VIACSAIVDSLNRMVGSVKDYQNRMTHSRSR